MIKSKEIWFNKRIKSYKWKGILVRTLKLARNFFNVTITRHFSQLFISINPFFSYNYFTQTHNFRTSW